MEVIATFTSRADLPADAVNISARSRRAAAGHISVATPFSREFISAACSISGHWDTVAKVWVFNSRDRERLTEILYKFWVCGAPEW